MTNLIGKKMKTKVDTRSIEHQTWESKKAKRSLVGVALEPEFSFSNVFARFA